MDKVWKAIERSLAKYLNGKRIPVHSTEGIACDVTTEIMDIQVKHGKSIPVFITKGMEQAVRDCREGKLPALYLHKKQSELGDGIICFRLKDFKDWYVNERN